MGYLEEQLAHIEEAERKHQELMKANQKAMERREKIKAAYPEAFEDIGSAFNLDKTYADDITKIVSINEGYMSTTELDTMRQSDEIDNTLSDVYTKAVKDRDYLSNNKEECLTALVDVAKSHTGIAFPVIANNIAEIVIDKEVKLQNLEQVMDVCRISLPNMEQSHEVKTATWRDAPKPLEKEEIQIGDVTVHEAPKRNIRINENHFPSENFRKFLLKQDYGKKGYLTPDDIAKVTEMNVCNRSVSDLTGIEYFTALKTLSCGENLLKTLDVSHNTALTSLKFNNNYLTTIDVSKNLELQELGCYGNDLSALDVSNNTALEILDCARNELTELDVSNNTILKNLDCSNNQLTKLNVNGCSELFKLTCYNNQLTDLDISSLEKLSMFDCAYNHLTKLDTSNNPWLDNINASNNDFSKSEKTVETEKPYAAPDPNAKYEVFTVKQGMTSGLWDAEIQKKGECASFNYSDMYGKLATYEDLKRGVMLNYHVDLPSYDEIKAVPDMLRQNGPGEVTIIVPQDLETLYDNIFEHMEFSTGVENAIKDYRDGLKSHGIDTKALDAAIDKRDELGVLKEVQETYDQYAAEQDRMSVEKEYNYEHKIEPNKGSIDR